MKKAVQRDLVFRSGDAYSGAFIHTQTERGTPIVGTFKVKPVRATKKRASHK